MDTGTRRRLPSFASVVVLAAVAVGALTVCSTVRSSAPTIVRAPAVDTKTAAAAAESPPQRAQGPSPPARAKAPPPPALPQGPFAKGGSVVPQGPAAGQDSSANELEDDDDVTLSAGNSDLARRAVEIAWLKQTDAAAAAEEERDYNEARARHAKRLAEAGYGPDTPAPDAAKK